MSTMTLYAHADASGVLRAGPPTSVSADPSVHPNTDPLRASR